MNTVSAKESSVVWVYAPSEWPRAFEGETQNDDAFGFNSKIKRHAQTTEPISIADLSLFTAVYPSVEAMHTWF